jgi:hypothetical protein
MVFMQQNSSEEKWNAIRGRSVAEFVQAVGAGETEYRSKNAPGTRESAGCGDEAISYS